MSAHASPVFAARVRRLPRVSEIPRHTKAVCSALVVPAQERPPAPAFAPAVAPARESRQINLPSGILRSAISRIIQIDWARTAALHLEKIDVHFMIAAAP